MSEKMQMQPPPYSDPPPANPYPPVISQQPQQYGGTQYGGFAPNQYSSNTTTVVTTQPQVQTRGPREWSSSMTDCCGDMGICLMGTFCGLCLACQTSGDMGESMCVPCCVPGWLIALRLKMRTQEKIPGSLLDDCCVSVCCGACVLCQLAREVRYVKLMDAQQQHRAG